jgi:hypothetical protein
MCSSQRNLTTKIASAATLVALLLTSGMTASAATFLDDFSAGPFHLVVSEPHDIDGDDDLDLNPASVIGGRRRVFVRHEAGSGTITADVVASAGGSVIYAATGSAIGEQLGFGYGSNIGGFPVVPMSENIASQRASSLAIDVAFATHEIPLELFYVSHAAEGAGVSGSSYMQTTLPASSVPYTAIYPFSELQVNSGTGTDFSDLDGITITFGRGAAPIPAGAQFRISAMRFVPEPSSAVVVGAAALMLGLWPRRRTRRGSRAAFGLAVALGAFSVATSSQAQVVKFQFAGTIDESDSNLVRIGDAFSGTFAYDLVNNRIPDSDPTRSQHFKLLGDPSIQMAYTAGSQTVERVGVVRWTTENREADTFTYLADTSIGPGDLTEGTISLVDPTGTIFDTDIPPASLELTDFAERRFTGRLDPDDVPDGEIHNFAGTIELLERIAVLPPRGDFNQNGAVDAADYVIWRKTVGQTGDGLAADVAGPLFDSPNGVVDDYDYRFWRARFGEQSATAVTGSFQPMSTSVPEPTAVLLLTIACSPFIFLHRRQCSLVLPKREKIPEKSRNSLGLGNLSSILAGTAPAVAWNH